MKRVLICTILRDVLSPHLDAWRAQLRSLYSYLKREYEVEVSVYENDSVDGTAEWVDTWLLGEEELFTGVKLVVTSETLGTQRYGSIWNVDRLRNLAAARQKCLDQVGDLSRFDKIAFIEPDVTYDPQWCSELILARHPQAAGLGEPDIYSGWSLRTERNPKESVFLYDTCATRATPDAKEWLFPLEGAWRTASLIPTDLGGVDSMCLHRVWSTFNCFCVYNARPFIDGARWGFVNHRLDTGQGWVDDGVNGRGHLDADTSVMCERFRARDYSKVFLNTNCLIRHA